MHIIINRMRSSLHYICIFLTQILWIMKIKNMFNLSYSQHSQRFSNTNKNHYYILKCLPITGNWSSSNIIWACPSWKTKKLDMNIVILYLFRYSFLQYIYPTTTKLKEFKKILGTLSFRNIQILKYLSLFFNCIRCQMILSVESS